MPQLKTPCAATETQHSQIDTFLKEKKKFASVLLPASRQAPGLWPLHSIPPTPVKWEMMVLTWQGCSVTELYLTLCDPHGLQHARLPCPPLSLRVCSNSCPLSQWCHPTISSSVIPLSSCLRSFTASGSFQWVSSSHQVAKVLEFQLQHQPFQWICRIDFL